MSTFRFVALLLTIQFCLAFSVAAQERTPQQQAEVEKLQSGVEEFFKRFNDPSAGPDQAFNLLVGKGPLKGKEELPALIEKARKLESAYGRYTGFDAAPVKSIGNDLVILRYLYKAERFPSVWRFYYYRTANGTMAKEWNLIEIRFDTNLDGLDK